MAVISLLCWHYDRITRIDLIRIDHDVNIIYVFTSWYRLEKRKNDKRDITRCLNLDQKNLRYSMYVSICYNKDWYWNEAIKVNFDVSHVWNKYCEIIIRTTVMITDNSCYLMKRNNNDDNKSLLWNSWAFIKIIIYEFITTCRYCNLWQFKRFIRYL